MEIFVKATNGVCYVGTADDSNGSDTSWTVEMQLADLEGCQPTPTPQQAECCDDTDFSIDIVDTGGSMTDEINGVTLLQLLWTDHLENFVGKNLEKFRVTQVQRFLIVRLQTQMEVLLMVGQMEECSFKFVVS